MKRLTEEQIEQLVANTQRSYQRDVEDAYRKTAHLQPASDVLDIALRVAQGLEVPDQVELRVMTTPSGKVFFDNQEFEIFAKTWRCKLVKPGEDPAGIIIEAMKAQVELEAGRMVESSHYLFAPFVAATEWGMHPPSRPERAFVYRAESRLIIPPNLTL